MCHLNDVSEDEISTFMIINLLGELSQVLSGLLLDLIISKNFTSRGLKLRKSMRQGMRMDLMVYWGLSCFLRY